MMLLLIFSALVASTWAQKIGIQHYIRAEKACLPKYPPEVKAQLHDLKVKRVLPDDASDDFKCFMSCLGQEMGLMDEKGEFHNEKLKDLTTSAISSTDVITPEEIHAAVEECTKIQHDVLCEKVHLYLTCNHDKLKHVELHSDMKESTAE
ncbi:uncharacterized protein LOC135843852 [Planococcus citri]|uniref:uncharacterized protein LOC135843852 n=1 Tax=Planococcus citri TaxID=170843 RepID=UPI0031F9B3ED